ncbi:MAG: [protein-PII] uridylyltransferase, partial [Gammaproteobacteria bacterium]
MKNSIDQFRVSRQNITAEIDKRLRRGEDGRTLVKFVSAEVDRILLQLWQKTADQHNIDDEIDVVAVGGYGRAELCLYSDWDILFLVRDHDDPSVKDTIESFLYALWDSNIHIGYAVRTVKECEQHCKEDLHAKTSLLESRLLYGQGLLYKQIRIFSHETWKKNERIRFCESKIEELHARRKKQGGTPFVMEPNIKENQGGLRDVSTIFWLCMAWYGVPTARHLIAEGIVDEGEFERFVQARNALLRIRCALHLINGREQDTLRFDDQVSVANLLGYQDEHGTRAVEAFMRDYFCNARCISDMADMFILHFNEAMHPKRFLRTRELEHGLVIRGHALTIGDEAEFLSDPLNFLRIFIESQREHRYLDSRALRLLRQQASKVGHQLRDIDGASTLFLQILRSRRNVATALRQMHETDLLGYMIPEFQRVTGHGQFDRYHVYTVDAHTLRAIDILRDIKLQEGAFIKLPLAREVMQHRIHRPEILYLAMLFHDIAKGKGGDHSILGEDIAREECSRLGLPADAIRLVAWLVRHHLLMAKTSQRYDLSDPEVIDHFAHEVGDLEYLEHLFLLTIADIAAVGPNVWTSWKEQLLTDLFISTREYLMTGQVHTEDRLERARFKQELVLRALNRDKDSGTAEILESMPVSCLLHFSEKQLATILQGMEAAKQGVAFSLDDHHAATRFYVWTKDATGLFAKLTASLSLLRAHTLSAQAFNLRNGMVLDEFVLVDPQQQPITEEHDLHRIQEQLQAVIEGKSPERPRKTRADEVDIMARNLPVRVRPLPGASTHVTSIQVSAAVRPGLLAQLALTLNDLGLDLKGANINTFGEKVIDVFFLTEQNGQQLTTERTSEVCRALESTARLDFGDQSTLSE